MDNAIKITRETEFYQGYIRFKMAVTNESTYVITDVELDFNFDEDLLRIDRHEPKYAVKREKFVLGNIDAGTSKSIAIYFDPLMCSKGTDINCHVTYKDHLGKLNAVFMEPKEIRSVCPIMQTESDINVGMLKDLIEVLPSRDSRVYEIQSGFNLKKLANLACEVLQNHDVRHIRTLHTRDEKTCEIWYYGKTKVTKNDVIIKVFIMAEHQTMELFVATQSAEALTGLLAEVGRELKQIVESRASGKGKVVNVSIKDSVIQRSNLLDMCDMDGNCDVNIVIEDSVVQRTNFVMMAVEAEEIKKEQDILNKADLTNSIGMQFMNIPAGEFMMGSNEFKYEIPVHKVKVSKPFYLGKYPVTTKEWQAVMGNNPSRYRKDNNPVESVSWNDVQEFIKKLNAREGTDKYRLPSEAEWEYACRAGMTTRYSFGDDSSKLGDYGWYNGYENFEEWNNIDNINNIDKKIVSRSTHPVGQKKPNPWGLYDMHGNVCEWVQDEFHGSYEGAPTDGSAWEKDSNSKSEKKNGFFSKLFGSNNKEADFSSRRIARGGGWSAMAFGCRSASRSFIEPDDSTPYAGFRLLREI